MFIFIVSSSIQYIIIKVPVNTLCVCPVLLSQTSDYPVILSLENHCSVEQQEVMAHHMSSILGSALVTSPLGEGMPTNFPSPEVFFVLFCPLVLKTERWL